MNSLQIARLCAQAADQRKGENILVLDLREISSVADYFVIISGTSEPHLKAIRNEIESAERAECPRAGIDVSQNNGGDGLPGCHGPSFCRVREFSPRTPLGDARRVEWA